MSSMSSKERLYAVLNGTPYDRTPITPIFMSWAANYIGCSYKDYYLDGDVLVAAQLAVVRAFNIDQISVISDPWREASGYGMQFDYPDNGVGSPKNRIINSYDDITELSSLVIDDIPRMKQRVESVAKMAVQIGQTHSVLGWVEGPFAEYANLRGLEDALTDILEHPEKFIEAARVITENAITFAIAQIQKGADMIGVGDAAASLIGPSLYSEFVLPLQKNLFDAIHNAGAKVKLHICGDINSIIGHMAATEADVLDLDSMVPIQKARQVVGENVTLCGNFDPSSVLLQGTPEEVCQAAQECIKLGGKKFILMPGCEVPPTTPEENIFAFCDMC